MLVAGAPVFRYHQYEPGSLLPPGAELIQVTCDPDEAARAHGRRGRRRRGVILAALADAVGEAARAAAQPREAPPRSAPGEVPLTSERALDLMNELAQPDAIYVNESTSTIEAMWERMRWEKPGSYYFGAAGGLGFAMPAVVGVQLAEPATARPTTASPPCGRRRSMACRWSSSSCATAPTAPCGGSPACWRRRACPASTCQASTSWQSPQAGSGAGRHRRRLRRRLRPRAQGRPPVLDRGSPPPGPRPEPNFAQAGCLTRRTWPSRDRAEASGVGDKLAGDEI